MVSDHAPIFFNWKEVSQVGPRPFRYEIMWKYYANFSTQVAKWWGISAEGIVMYRLSTKLENVRRNV
jgi:hypothetical protein